MKDRKFTCPVSIPINGHEDYTISSDGKVFSFKSVKFLKPSDNGLGYYQVQLSKEGAVKCVYLHRLVAEHFIDNKYNLPQVNHKDFNKSNNCVDNLEWCTAKENSNHAEGTYKKANPPKYSKSEHPRSKLSDIDLANIKTMYENNEKVTKIASKFDVHFTQIYKIIKRDELQRR